MPEAVAGLAPRVAVEIEIQVQFYDLDPLEIVWHGNYARFFEQARCALLDKIDYNYARMRDSGYMWPVVDLHVRFVRPAAFGQILVIRAELMEWENRLLIAYVVTDKGSKERLTKGQTVQVAVDMATREMCFVSPRILFEKLGLTPP